ncbi:MAG TPA: hypothetical protein VEX60_02680 [Pyrinomonadaceae bacterium]|nr:hypothetical protein [Pyrinomonadaceae bacterium]
MPRYEHRVFRVKVEWDGGDYYLQAMIQKSEWMNVDHLGEKGWEFIAFVPNHEVYINASFKDGELPFVRLAVFKRQMEEGEEMDWGVTRAH